MDEGNRARRGKKKKSSDCSGAGRWESQKSGEDPKLVKDFSDGLMPPQGLREVSSNGDFPEAKEEHGSRRLISVKKKYGPLRNHRLQQRGGKEEQRERTPARSLETVTFQTKKSE